MAANLRWVAGVVWGVLVGGVLGCQALPMSPTATPIPAFTATPAVSPTPDLTAVPSTPEPPKLLVWVPDVLLPQDDSPVTTLFISEVNEFSAQSGVEIELRRKKADDVGGILATLRSAAVVAPVALPDVTLLRRADLTRAVEAGLIQPLEGRVSSSVIAELFPAALRLGRVDNQLFGLPYLMNLYLTAYDPDEVVLTRWGFSDVLETEARLTFPAASAAGLSDVVWLQYLAAVGYTPETGEPVELAPSAVLVLLSFYEDMLAQNRIPRSVVDFDAPADYIQQVVDGRADLAIITTDQLGRLRGAGLAYASVPNSTGAPATLMDGWVWVIVTPTPEQQSMSGRFINWMMDAERHSAYADQIAMPPSLRGSLRRWGFEGLDNALLESLLADSPVVMPEVTTSSAARALQSALLSVLSGDASAAEAAAAALTP